MTKSAQSDSRTVPKGGSLPASGPARSTVASISLDTRKHPVSRLSKARSSAVRIKTKLERWIDQYLDHLVLTAGRSTNTMYGYRLDLARYAQFCNHRGIGDPERVDPQVVGEFLSSLTTGGLAPASVARALSAVKGFHKYLLHGAVISTNPARPIKTPRLPRRLPNVLTIAQMQRIVSSPQDCDPHGVRNRALLTLLYGCGLRVSEAAQMRVEDVDFAEKFVRVTGKGGRERLVPFGPWTERALKAYLNGPRRGKEARLVTERLFLGRGGRGLSRMGVWLIVRQAALRAGLEKRVSPHTFRHSFATHLIQAGADLRSVQAMLGHRSISTTQIYTHLDREHLANVHRLCHPLEAGWTAAVQTDLDRD